jgi:hypothetical protein
MTIKMLTVTREGSPGVIMHPTTDLAALRDSIEAGSYEVDSREVAGSIVRRLVEVSRLRRALSNGDSSIAEMFEAGGGPYSPVWRT